MSTVRRRVVWALMASGMIAAACGGRAEEQGARASGYVEATDVRVAPQVGGRLIEVAVGEGDRVAAGALVARLDTADTELALRRAEADRDQALAALKLLEAGARAEGVRQARGEGGSGQGDNAGGEAGLAGGNAALQRFDALLKSNAGSRKQRDDAATRRDVAVARVNASRDRARAASETVARLRAGARPEEIAGGRARVAAAEAQIAVLKKNLADAVL